MIRYQSGKVWREKLRAFETEKNLDVKAQKMKMADLSFCSEYSDQSVCRCALRLWVVYGSAKYLAGQVDFYNTK